MAGRMRATPKPCDCPQCKGKLSIIYKNVMEDGERKRYCQQGYFKKYPPKKIPKESKRRKREKPIYMANRDKMLKDNPECALKIPGICTGKATTAQHLEGRLGDLYTDPNNLVPACNACNLWAADNSAEAVKLGAALWRVKVNKRA